MEHSQNKLKKATKLYWILFGAAAIVLGVLALLGWYAISFGDVKFRFYNYNQYSSLLFYANLISFFVLLVLSAYKQMSNGQSLFYFPTYLLFAVFSFILFSVLNEKEFHLRQLYDLNGGSFSMNHIFSTALSVIGVLVTVLVYVGVLMLKRRR